MDRRDVKVDGQLSPGARTRYRFLKSAALSFCNSCVANSAVVRSPHVDEFHLGVGRRLTNTKKKKRKNRKSHSDTFSAKSLVCIIIISTRVPRYIGNFA